MPITLTPETQKLIEDRLRASGLSSADDLVRLALESLEVTGEDVEDLDPETRAALARAEAQAARGEGVDAGAAFDALRRTHLGA